MSTPIEIVHGHLAKLLLWEFKSKPTEYTTALATVLRDAERFKALELAHQDIYSLEGWGVYVQGEGWKVAPRVPLANFADKLLEQSRSNLKQQLCH